MSKHRGNGSSLIAPTNHELFLAPSVVDGIGVFSRSIIATGNPVVECGGLLLHRDDLDCDARAMQVGPDVYLAEDPAHPRIDDFLNHCCDPNLGFLTGTLTLYALRDIEPGEELFFNYSTTMNEPGWTVSCLCRSALCRGKIQSYCDLSEQERLRLSDIALAYLRKTSRRSRRTRRDTSGELIPEPPSFTGGS